MHIEGINDLDELHTKYTAAEIVARIRNYYEIHDGIGNISDLELFRHAVRDYCSYANNIEQTAQASYLDYLMFGRVPLVVARCLFPNKLCRPRKLT